MIAEEKSWDVSPYYRLFYYYRRTPRVLISFANYGVRAQGCIRTLFFYPNHHFFHPPSFIALLPTHLPILPHYLLPHISTHPPSLPTPTHIYPSSHTLLPTLTTYLLSHTSTHPPSLPTYSPISPCCGKSISAEKFVLTNVKIVNNFLC